MSGVADIAFDNRTAVVTGAGRGLGRAYALELARRGARVVVNDPGGAVDGEGISARAADEVTAEIAAAGGEAVASYDSVSTPQGGERIVQTAVDAFGSVDAVINNAGILRDKSFANLTAADAGAVLDVHLRGAFHVTGPAFRVMKERGYGRIVYASSASGLFGNFGQANYGAAKMGLVGLMNVTAVEGAKYGILANALAPVAATRMTGNLLGPLQEHASPDCVTPMAVFLASEQCDFTHHIWTAGGGRFGRVFIGVNEGWFAGPGAAPSAEQVRDHLDEIRDIDSYIVPDSSADELKLLGRLLAG